MAFWRHAARLCKTFVGWDTPYTSALLCCTTVPDRRSTPAGIAATQLRAGLREPTRERAQSMRVSHSKRATDVELFARVSQKANSKLAKNYTRGTAHSHPISGMLSGRFYCLLPARSVKERSISRYRSEPTAQCVMLAKKEHAESVWGRTPRQPKGNHTKLTENTSKQQKRVKRNLRKSKPCPQIERQTVQAHHNQSSDHLIQDRTPPKTFLLYSPFHVVVLLL